MATLQVIEELELLTIVAVETREMCHLQTHIWYLSQRVFLKKSNWYSWSLIKSNVCSLLVSMT